MPQALGKRLVSGHANSCRRYVKLALALALNLNEVAAQHSHVHCSRRGKWYQRPARRLSRVVIAEGPARLLQMDLTPGYNSHRLLGPIPISIASSGVMYIAQAAIGSLKVLCSQRCILGDIVAM